jgi:hypothetical protein
MRVFRCENCQARVYFNSSVCVKCNARLGFMPEERTMGAFSMDGLGVLRRYGDAQSSWRPCANSQNACACGWLVHGKDPNPLCRSCRLTATIPDQGTLENRIAWRDLEAAKRVWLASMLDLHLPVRSRLDDPVHGLAFHFLRQIDASHPILTGHDAGDITINAAESDPVERERSKLALLEPYRTLLGHFRHESGHYYWDLLVRDSALMQPFRALFGDERMDYAKALARHYEHGPAPDWQLAHVSGYATMHPWEDWAETWAHYLHMVDLLGTARSWKLSVDAFEPPEISDQSSLSPEFLELIHEWLPLTLVVNSLNRSLGHADAYPFAFSNVALRKMQFVHDVIRPFSHAGTFPG